MTWHVEPKSLEAYARGAIDDVRAYSVEAHLLACAACRTEIAVHADRGRLEALWEDIDEIAAAPGRGPVEALLLKLGVKDHVARLLAATPSLRLSWFAALALVLGFALVAAHLNPRGYVLFLVIAPLLPLAGVALAYGPGVDPTYEIGLAAPMRSFHLLLIRAAAVLVSSTVLSGLGALALPQLDWTLAAWLLPALGLTAASLALSTFVHPLRAAAIVALTWVAGTALALMSSGTAPDVFGEAMQVALLTVTLGSGLLLYQRRESFERGVRR